MLTLVQLLFAAFAVTCYGTFVKTLVVVPLSSLPPTYPVGWYPSTARTLPGPVPSANYANVMGLLFIPLNATHGYRCTASAVNKRWILTSSYCIKDFNRRTAVVYLPNHESKQYEAYGIKIALRHREYSNENSTADVGMLKLRRFYKYLPYLRPRIHGAVEFAQRPGSIWTTAGWRSPNNLSRLVLRQSQQVTASSFCKPQGTKGLTFLCTTVAPGASSSGTGPGDSGMPLFGKQKPWNERIARIGIYSGSSKLDSLDTTRINYFVILARYKADMAEARFGNYTNWVSV